MKKIKKIEIIWILTVSFFYFMYILPGVPKYGSNNGMIIHAVLTIIPLWISVYSGQYVLNKMNKLREDEDVK